VKKIEILIQYVCILSAQPGSAESIVKVSAYSTGMAASLTATGLLASYVGSTSGTIFDGTFRSSVAGIDMLHSKYNFDTVSFILC
jgi:hypothetical protein